MMKQVLAMWKGYTEMPSPGIEPDTSVSGAVRRIQVPRLNVGIHWGYISIEIEIEIVYNMCRQT
jgi:hypothetical protein